MKTNSRMARIVNAALIPTLFVGVILSLACNAQATDNSTAEKFGLENPVIVQAYTPKAAPVEVVENPEVAPQFKDGEIEIYHRLAQNMKYPKDAIAAGQGGKVIVEFIVNPNGTATDFIVAQSSGAESLDNEALRVCKDQLSSNWIPGKDKGKAVACSFTLPVIFRLN